MATKFVSVDDGLKKIKICKQNFSKRQIYSISAKAINETLVDVHATVIKQIQSEYNAPPKRLKSIKIEKAKVSNPIGYISAPTKPIPLKEFPAVQNSSNGTIITVKKGSPRIIPYAFIIKRGKRHVFGRGRYRRGGKYGFVRRFKRVKRTGTDRPISPMLTLSVNAMVVNKKVMRAAIKVAKESLPKYLKYGFATLQKRIPKK